jgi:nitrogen fixation NifU-like protein
MKSTTYSEKTLDHFRNPRNVGVLEGDDVAIGRVGNPVCGDLMEMYIRVRDDRIQDITFQTFGCGSAVATSSMTTELVKGMTLDEALQVTRGDVADALDGLPPIKMHCSNLAADALHDAIKNWRAGIRLEPLDPGAVPAKACGTPASAETSAPPAPRIIGGADEYAGKGFYTEKPDPAQLEGRRVLVVDSGADSLAYALDAAAHTARVVFVTAGAQLPGDAELRSRAKRSDLKVLLQTELLELGGEGVLEKVRVHDLDEDEEYELFVDAVVVLAQT